MTDLLTQEHRDGTGRFNCLRAIGDDGYDRMGPARSLGLHPVPSWGQQGWDLGSWPYVVVYHGHVDGRHWLVEEVEGDVTAYAYDAPEERDAATDELAFFHWRGEAWTEGIASHADAPDKLRGPFSWARCEGFEAVTAVA